MTNFEKICTLDNEIQSQIIDSILTEKNIPHVMRSYHDTALDGLFQNQKGWGHIEAPAEFREEILAIIADLAKEDSSESN